MCRCLYFVIVFVCMYVYIYIMCMCAYAWWRPEVQSRVSFFQSCPLPFFFETKSDYPWLASNLIYIPEILPLPPGCQDKAVHTCAMPSHVHLDFSGIFHWDPALVFRQADWPARSRQESVHLLRSGFTSVCQLFVWVWGLHLVPRAFLTELCIWPPTDLVVVVVMMVVAMVVMVVS